MNFTRDKISINALHSNNMYGQGITVAVLDTGIYPHLDFMLGRNRIIEFYDSTTDSRCNPFDDNGHGTAVTGILCGSGIVSSGKYIGVAPKANIVGIKAIASSGEGDGSAILSGMRYILKNSNRLGIRIVCMSFGSTPIPPDPFMIAVEALWRSGIVVVASIGNDGPEPATVKSPAASPSIISVGGVEYVKGDKAIVTKFSSRGPFGKFSRPDIVAPSVRIITTNALGEYSPMTGTSMAAPLIAGICACILSSNKALKPDKVKDIIIHSTDIIDNDPNASGFGLITAAKVTKFLRDM